MSYTYQISKSDDLNESVVVIIDGEVFNAASTHPNYREIVKLLTSVSAIEEPFQDEDEQAEYEEELELDLRDLFDASLAIGTKFESLSDRVRVAGGTVYFDGDPVHSILAEQILTFHRQGLPFMPLVNFYEKLASNPNPASRETAYNWLQAQGNFTINEDGDLIAYKGLRSDRTSVHSGPAIVDGVFHNGHIPYEVGSIVQMGRNSVNADASVGCSVGLHAGTFSYASSFAQGVLCKVQINPMNIVSVPTDCSAKKMRVCELLVLENTDIELPTPLDGFDADFARELDDAYEYLGNAEDYGEETEIVVPAGALRVVLDAVRSMVRRG